MKEPTYVKIFCEQKRKDDMRWRFRWVHDDRHPKPGRTVAENVDGHWRCCCCGTPVKVVW